MKKLFLILALFVSANLFFTSCGSEENKEENKDTAAVVEQSKTELLLEEIVKNGDLINSKKVPTMIKSTAVNEAAEGTLHIIDIRTGKDFADGHIKGAVNVKMSELLDYVNTIDMGSFEKVVMVCYSGQTASYATSILQMLGYDNVYAMKWGMAGWNKKFSGKWLNNVSDKLVEQLSTEAATKGEKGNLPEFDCQKSSGKDILEARARKVLADGFKPVGVTVDDIVANPGGFYIINYWPAKLYNLGHINGAIQYKPKASLSTQTDLLTLPTDKTIVTYCFTGQHSAFVTAYLRILGYKAKSLKFGANSFMNSMMIENEEIGHGFSEKQIHDYPFETSEYVETEGEVQEGGC